MDCVFLCETYEHGVSVLWRASAALLRWQRLAIRTLVLCAQRATAVRALRTREEGGSFSFNSGKEPVRGYLLRPHADFACRVRQRCCELSKSHVH